MLELFVSIGAAMLSVMGVVLMCKCWGLVWKMVFGLFKKFEEWILNKM